METLLKKNEQLVKSKNLLKPSPLNLLTNKKTAIITRKIKEKPIKFFIVICTIG